MLANKGFPQIRGKLAEDGIKFQMPAYTTYKVASARIHVERSIQRMKIYRILSEKLSLDLVPHVGKMTDKCGVLANLQKPIIIAYE